MVPLLLFTIDEITADNVLRQAPHASVSIWTARLLSRHEREAGFGPMFELQAA
jgi:hypothetical protein